MLRARLIYPEAVLRSLVAESMLRDFQLQNFCRHSLISIFCLLSPTPTNVWLLQKLPCIRLFHKKNYFVYPAVTQISYYINRQSQHPL